MKELKKELKISPSLREQEKISYASDVINVPEGGIDCNEGCNPYGFPPALEEAMADFDIKRFGPYPHSHAIYDGLREYWKGYSDIEPENVLLADGSISALYVIFGLFQAPGAVVLGNAPTFSDAEMAARMLGMEWRAVALNPDRNYRFDPDAFVEQITDDVTMIYIDNPNNPTGQVINLYAIEKILDRALEVGAGVVIDEAYGDFMPNQNSAMTLTEEYPNLIMVRTMSKAFGLAGLRVGYIIAGKPIIRYMKKLRDPYMVSEFAREMAGKALMYLPVPFLEQHAGFRQNEAGNSGGAEEGGAPVHGGDRRHGVDFRAVPRRPGGGFAEGFLGKQGAVRFRCGFCRHGAKFRPDSAAEDGGFPDSAGSRSADSQRRFR